MMREDLVQTVAPLYRGLRRFKNRLLNLADPPLVVLAYHRVAQLASDPHQLAVTPENFAAQMDFLRRNCRLLRLDEPWAGLRTPAVAVTFDDGYADNLHQALPVLETAGVPATFFISTGQLGTRAGFWSDELAQLLLGAGEVPPVFALDDRSHGGQWPTAGDGQRRALHERLHRAMLTVDAERRERWLVRLRDWRGTGRSAADDCRALTRDEVRILAAGRGVTIGAHGVTHTPLALLGEEQQRREIVASKRELEALLDREVALFAYPFGGRRQYDRTSRRLCREAGFRRAVTTLPGQVHCWSDPFRLPRQLVRNWDGATFAAKLESFRV